ncbi:MAG: hypothetical protein ACJ76H_02615 [Bacteriovoracaceae bacterium]
MKLLALAIFIASTSAFGESFLPLNNSKIPAHQKLMNVGITEEQYNSVIKKIETIYDPEFSAAKKSLLINSNWEDGTVNAFSENPDPSTPTIILYGGLARHPSITRDGFALVLCHEIGHHLGGAPKISSDLWASAEGQADYFASLKCIRRFFQDEDNEKALSVVEVPEVLREECEKIHSEEEARICIRSGLAAVSVEALVAEIAMQKPGKFQTPDKSKVKKTNEGYPSAQCRLDTFFQGALCDQPVSESVSDVDPAKGTCHEKNHSLIGLRPKCWFKSRL